MRNLSVGLALATFVTLAGCAQYYSMPPDPRWFGEETVTIETHDGQRFAATATNAGGFPGWDIGAEAPVPAPAVQSVTRSDVARNTAIGVGYGALAGFAAGAALGLASGDDHCEVSDSNQCYFVLSAWDKALVLGVLLHVVGAGVGALVGLASGRREVFVAPQAGGMHHYVPDLSLRPGNGGGTAALHWTF